MEIHISYWLMPSEPFFKHLQDLIKLLANKYNSPNFEPHVTVYSGPGKDKNCNSIIEKVTSSIGPISLNVGNVNHSPIYIKTVFIEFQLNPLLLELSNQLRNLSEEPSDYILKPHLSLLYKKLDYRERQALASEINLNWNKITFSRIKAISTPSDVQSKEDIALWKDLYYAQLT